MLHTRTIREAAAWFKSQDPQTCLTETAIRTLVRTGQVPCVRVGKKYLVTLEALEEYLTGYFTDGVLRLDAADVDEIEKMAQAFEQFDNQ